MSKTSATGSFGIGLQTAKGTALAISAVHYMPAMNIDIQPDQGINAIPPEVGGALWTRGAYKTGIMGQGGVSLNSRATAIGYVLHAFAGTATGASSGGIFKHTFMEHRTDKSSLPWLTLVKNVSDVWYERFKDARLDTLRLDFPQGGIVTAQAGFVAMDYNCDDTSNQMPTETFDATPVFVTTDGSITVTGMGADPRINRLSLDFSNGLTRDERSLCESTLDDITMIRRSCRVSLDTYLQDATLYNMVYRNASSGSAAWSPVVYQAQLDILVKTAEPVTGSTYGSIRVVLPQLDLLAYPVALAGQDIVRVALSANLSLDESQESFYIEVMNNAGATTYALGQ